MVSSWSTPGDARCSVLLVQEELGLALRGCCIMGLTAAMLAAPYLRSDEGSISSASR